MEENSVRLGLPLLVPGQGQKEVTHNEAILILEWFSAPSVLSRTANQPAELASGDAWIVPDTTEAEAWTGHEGQVALRWSSDWRFLVVPAGLRVFVEDEGVSVVRAGAGWRKEPVLTGGVGAPDLPSGGGTVDAEARDAIAAMRTALQQVGILS